MTAQRRLAAYGTLRPGQANHHELAGLTGQWSRGSVRADLYADGWGAARGFPGLVLNPNGEIVPVHLFVSDDLPDHWPRLDAFEGEGYRRVVTEVSTPGGVVDACVYELAPRASWR